MPTPNPSLDEDDLTYKPGGAAITALTVSVGTADGTVADVGGAFNQTTLNNNFRDLADTINNIRTALINANIIQQD